MSVRQQMLASADPEIRAAAFNLVSRTTLDFQNKLRATGDVTLQAEANRLQFQPIHPPNNQQPQLYVPSRPLTKGEEQAAVCAVIGAAVIVLGIGAYNGINYLYQNAGDWLLKPKSAAAICESNITASRFHPWNGGERIIFPKGCNMKEVAVECVAPQSREIRSTIQSEALASGVAYNITAPLHSCKITQFPAASLK